MCLEFHDQLRVESGFLRIARSLVAEGVVRNSSISERVVSDFEDVSVNPGRMSLRLDQFFQPDPFFRSGILATKSHENPMAN